MYMYDVSTILCFEIANDVSFACLSNCNQEELSTIKASGRAFYKTMISDSDYTEFDVFTKWLGVSQ